MKKKLFITALILIMVLSTVVFAYAEGDISTYDTGEITFITDRTSRTSDDIIVDVGFTQKVDSYNVVIYLQKKVNGVWKLDTTNPDYVYYNNGFNSYDFTFSRRYTHLESGENYRIMCVSKDYIGSTSYTFTAYSKQF